MSACGWAQRDSHPAEPCAISGHLIAFLSGNLHVRTFVFFRLLLQLTQPQQTSFALERNLRTQQEIEDKMKGFGFKEDTLQRMTEVSDPWGLCERGTMDIFPGAHTLLSKTRSELIRQRTSVSFLYAPWVTSSRKCLFLAFLLQQLEAGALPIPVAAWAPHQHAQPGCGGLSGGRNEC